MQKLGKLILSRQKAHMSLVLKESQRRGLGVLAYAGVPKMDMILVWVNYIHLGFKKSATSQLPIVVRIELRL